MKASGWDVPPGPWLVTVVVFVACAWLAVRFAMVRDPYQPTTRSRATQGDAGRTDDDEQTVGAQTDGEQTVGTAGDAATPKTSAGTSTLHALKNLVTNVARSVSPWFLRTPPIDIPVDGPTFPATGGLAIACSGGGIRAAAFTLGGLQRLRDEDGEGPPDHESLTALLMRLSGETRPPSLYAKAARVYGVSGGSYMATSMHLAERHSGAIEGPQLFGTDSPEADWLRRKSSYLLPSRKAWFRGLYSIIFGLGINLAMVGAAIWLGTAFLAWTLKHASLAPTGLTDTVATRPSFWQLGSLQNSTITWMVVACLIGGFGYLLVAKAVSKYSRGQLATLGPTTILLSLAVALFFCFAAMPAVLVTVHNLATSNSPNRPTASAIAAIGLVDDATCSKAIREDFERQARLAWVSTPDAEDRLDTKGDLPFTYGACGKQYTDNAIAFESTSKGGEPVDADVCPTPSAALDSYKDPVPQFCAPARDTTAGWGARLAAALALLTTVATIVRGMTSQGTENPTSRVGRIASAVRSAVLPWTALAIVVAVVAIVTFRVLRYFLVDASHVENPWVWSAVLVYPLLRFLSDATTSSLHPFYKERISETFFVKRKTKKVSPLENRDQVDVTSPGKNAQPSLAVLCVANVQDVDYVPAQRGCVTFRFQTGDGNSAFIGVSDRRLPLIPPSKMSAETYSRYADPGGKDTTLPAAVAASGAAFSPVIGRLSKRVRPYRIVLTLANARLGVWLPNPYGALAYPERPGKSWLAVGRRRLDKPGTFRILKEAFGRQSIYDGCLYVTDGGHFDNTGIVEALRDQPRVLIVLDASADVADSLDALADAMTTARMDLNLSVEPIEEKAHEKLITPPVTEEDPAPRPSQPWLHLRATETARGADSYVCDIYFVKNVLSQGPDLELDSYRREHPDFPITTTVNQFYGEYDFEAYRQLGWRNVDKMLTSPSGT